MATVVSQLRARGQARGTESVKTGRYPCARDGPGAQFHADDQAAGVYSAQLLGPHPHPPWIAITSSMSSSTEIEVVPMAARHHLGVKAFAIMLANQITGRAVFSTGRPPTAGRRV